MSLLGVLHFRVTGFLKSVIQAIYARQLLTKTIKRILCKTNTLTQIISFRFDLPMKCDN